VGLSKNAKWGAFAAFAAAVVLILLNLTSLVDRGLPMTMTLGTALVLILVAVCMLVGVQALDLSFGKANVKVVYFEHAESTAVIAQRTLDDETIQAKEQHAKEVQRDHALPGQNAPRFSALPTLADDLLIRPSAYPMTPMYLLDNAYRILDWNEAFTVAFDRTMEGRKGTGVLEWTYFLDNYEDVLDHGTKVFGNPETVPTIDVETIAYTSRRYGKLTAIKRAYQIPDDSGACLGWLITLDLKFAEQSQHEAYSRDLIRVLGNDLMWSEYAMSYDRVLNNTRVYPELLDRLIGGHDGMREIPQDASIIDLGAGTGNLAYQLMRTGRDRVIVAAENNRVMLEILRSKCRKFLRPDMEGGGIIAVKQDVTSLLGLDDNQPPGGLPRAQARRRASPQRATQGHQAAGAVRPYPQGSQGEGKVRRGRSGLSPRVGNQRVTAWPMAVPLVGEGRRGHGVEGGIFKNRAFERGRLCGSVDADLRRQVERACAEGACRPPSLAQPLPGPRRRQGFHQQQAPEHAGEHRQHTRCRALVRLHCRGTGI